jgi:hypothetical protein
MANGLFIESFRGAGTSGATGVGSTQRGLQLAESGRLGLQDTRDQARINSLIQGAIQLNQIRDPQQKVAFLQNRRAELEQSGIGTEDTDEALAFANAGDFASLQEVTDQAIELGQRLSGGSSASASAFAPQTIRKIIGQDEEGNDVFQLFDRQVFFNPADNTTSVNEVPIEGDLVTSTGETISQKRAEEVAAIKKKKEAEIIAEAEASAETAPLVAKTKAFIGTQVKLAEKEATERGEVITDLARAQAALPGLTEVVDKLRELAPIATSTFGGRVFDTAVKELGFGATEGATASAKFGAMVNNQVLPLLKPTFGAAFTKTEGDALRATMGDKNASVEEKMATLDAFLEQKQRDIETKQLQLDQSTVPAAPVVQAAPQAATQPVALFSTALNRAVTEQEIADTIAANPGVSREQILQQLGVQ